MAGNSYYPSPQGLFGLRPPAPKSKVFVSYHHERDQAYYDRFTTVFADGYDIITDTSIERKIGSEDVSYQQQVIREEHITGSSMTVVLCGPETWKRRWIDWEIHMTLNKEHGLLGIALPTASRDAQGRFIVPNRLHANIATGFAQFIHWTEDPHSLKSAIDAVRSKSSMTANIRNSDPRMQRSLS